MRPLALSLVALSLTAAPALASPQAEPAADVRTARPAATPAFYAADPRLRALVLEALASNPSIAEAAATYRASSARVPQVTSLPDPMVSLNQAIRRPETRVGSQLNTLTLTQAYPWFGKRELRGEVAAEQANAAREMIAARQRQVIADVKDAFYNLAYVDAAIRISREERSLLDHYEQLARSRYETGQGLDQPVIKIQAEITKVTNRLQVLEQQRGTLAARLNTLRDRPPQEPIAPVAGAVPIPSVSLDLSRLYEIGGAERPELRASRALEARDEKAVALAKKDYKPDFTFGVTYGNILGRDMAPPPAQNGKDTLGVSVGLTIPIWRKKYDAGVREAAESLVARKQATSALLNEVEFGIRDQALRAESLRDQISLFEKVLIPQAEESLQSTESAYETGQLGVLELLDSERVLLQVRLSNERQRSDYLVALANLERAVGTRFPE